MYKNIEILDKEKFKKTKVENIDPKEIGKKIGMAPLGFLEVIDASKDGVVIISAKENGEFLNFVGVSPEVNIFKKENVYVPLHLRTYPFLNITAKDENEKLNSVIGIDVNEEYVGKKGEAIFKKDGELEDSSQVKVNGVRELNRQREISKKIVAELAQNDLLEKKDFKIIVDDKERTILNEFYVVNRDKLIKLDDKTLANWARKGWISLIDAHLKSTANFEKIVTNS